MEVSINGGTPIFGWFIVEKPIILWMFWGYATGNLHIAISYLQVRCPHVPGNASSLCRPQW